MCLYTHIVVGAVAGQTAPHVLLAPVFGLGSHIVLDYFPHYDFEKVSVELLLGAAAFSLLILAGWTGTNPMLGALFGALPDVENLLWKKGYLRDEQKVFPSHSGLVPHGREIGAKNLAVQTALVVLCLGIMTKL